MAYNKKNQVNNDMTETNEVENILTTSETTDNNASVEESVVVSPHTPIQPPDETDDVLTKIKTGIRDVAKRDIAMDVNKDIVKIQNDELIPIRSVVRGGFNWRCKKSGIFYRWPSLGHVEYLPYEDVYQMYTQNKHYLTKPFVIIDDGRVIKMFKLIDVYKKVSSVIGTDLEDAINDVNAMRQLCEKSISVNMGDLLRERLIGMYNDDVLTNNKVIKVAEEILKCEIMSE